MELSKHFRSHAEVRSPDWTHYETVSHTMRASYLAELAASARRGATVLVRIVLAKRLQNKQDATVPFMNLGDPRNDQPLNRWTGGNGGV